MNESSQPAVDRQPWYRPGPRGIGLALLAALLFAGAVLSQLNVRLASSQATSLVSAHTAKDVPLDDPMASVWNRAAPIEVPLSAQLGVVPAGGGSIRSVSARSLNDGKRIYFRLEWQDSTENVSAFAPQDFRDAAAIEFPANGVSSLPSFCMGQIGGQVNIWQWKGDWQADIDQGFVNVPEAYPDVQADFYPFSDDDTFYPGRAVGNAMSQVDRKSPVEDLVAAGFGTLTTGDVQTVDGKGVWQDGKWYVLFARDMDTRGDFYVPFKGGQTTNIAFAVWDGAHGERNGIKSVSTFADLQIEADKSGANVPSLVVLAVLAVIVLAGGGYVLYLERLKRGS